MTPSTPTRRRAFVTPTSTPKRRRVMTQARILKSMQPELKQFVSVFDLTSTPGSNFCTASIPSIMSQGDDGDRYIGSKFRILRIRVYFDYTDVTITSGVRLQLGIPKDPTATTINATSGLGTTSPANYRQVTMLKDMFLKTDGSNLNSYMEWNGPLNVEMNDNGTSPLKNNLILQINSTGVGDELSTVARTRIEVMFTG